MASGGRILRKGRSSPNRRRAASERMDRHMTPQHIGGLDVSTARIGYAAPSGALISITAKAGADDPARRLHQLRTGLTTALVRYPPLPDLIGIEGYSLGMMTVTRTTSTGSHKTPTGVLSKIRLGEVGGMVRLHLFDNHIAYVDIPPTSLKRFATGRGNADKATMLAAARKHGVDVANDVEADAFHARRMALGAHGYLITLLDHEADAIAALTW
jgi:crossover junction endodeoxyribonuclease RuvC